MPKSLNKRQEIVLAFLEKNSAPVAVSVILSHIQASEGGISRMTVNRDLRELQNRKYIKKIGSGRGVEYTLTPEYGAIRPIDRETYFQIDLDKREIKNKFNFAVFSLFNSIFTQKELDRLEKINSNYQKNVRKLSPTALKREYERLTIELSWKSSKIEGNTYSLLETEHLLREHKEPKGHTREETAMILNHKTALDYIRISQKRFKKLDLRDIEDVHSLLVKDLGVAKNIRSRLVRIGGTVYQPLNNKFQIREAVEKTCDLANKQKNPFAKAIIAMLMIAYIQPFEDGNKRASRLIGNALLIAHGACPLSFRSIDELEYKKAVILFYEQNNYSYFKELFINQFEFAVNNYFG
ncbi:MAG: Fic family protein [Candidatus Magasanikbacteria bacterium]|nr:Fic family protein [Candidatus Magasanikbacteria bacterium]